MLRRASIVVRFSDPLRARRLSGALLQRSYIIQHRRRPCHIPFRPTSIASLSTLSPPFAPATKRGDERSSPRCCVSIHATKPPGCGWRQSPKLLNGGVSAWNVRWQSIRTTKARIARSRRCPTRRRRVRLMTPACRIRRLAHRRLPIPGTLRPSCRQKGRRQTRRAIVRSAARRPGRPTRSVRFANV